jgi:hypothetical protein
MAIVVGRVRHPTARPTDRIGQSRYFKTAVVCSVGALSLIACGGTQDVAKTEGNAEVTSAPFRIQEGYPESVRVALDRRAEALIAAAEVRPDTQLAKRVQSVLTIGKLWPRGTPVTVAFRDGSPETWARIVDATRAWSAATNLNFDFWTDSTRETFRVWTPGDADYRTHIRIAFGSGRDGGYWSHVGRDAIDSAVVKPGQPSMNFEGFDKQLPGEWRAIVLHEFGHAIGFQHEHQSPTGVCEREFRWEDDPGYVPTHDTFGQFIADSRGRRPGIYTVLGGPPNNWSRRTIDYNLRMLPNTGDEDVSAFDSASIMKYYFDIWIFRSGRASPCYSDQNVALSVQDRNAANKHYPRDPSVAARAEAARARELSRALDTLPAAAGARDRLAQEIRATLERQDRVSKSIP